jgi:hypothetical protein
MARLIGKPMLFSPHQWLGENFIKVDSHRKTEEMKGEF